MERLQYKRFHYAAGAGRTRLIKIELPIIICIYYNLPTAALFACCATLSRQYKSGSFLSYLVS